MGLLQDYNRQEATIVTGLHDLQVGDKIGNCDAIITETKDKEVKAGVLPDPEGCVNCKHYRDVCGLSMAKRV